MLKDKNAFHVLKFNIIYSLIVETIFQLLYMVLVFKSSANFTQAKTQRA